MNMSTLTIFFQRGSAGVISSSTRSSTTPSGRLYSSHFTRPMFSKKKVSTGEEDGCIKRAEILCHPIIAACHLPRGGSDVWWAGASLNSSSHLVFSCCSTCPFATCRRLN